MIRDAQHDRRRIRLRSLFLFGAQFVCWSVVVDLIPKPGQLFATLSNSKLARMGKSKIIPFSQLRQGRVQDLPCRCAGGSEVFGRKVQRLKRFLVE